MTIQTALAIAESGSSEHEKLFDWVMRNQDLFRDFIETVPEERYLRWVKSFDCAEDGTLIMKAGSDEAMREMKDDYGAFAARQTVH